MKRRTLLTTGTTLSIASLSGCLGIFQSDDDTPEPTTDDFELPTEDDLDPIPPEHMTEAKNYISDAPNSEQDHYDARTELEGIIDIESERGLAIFNPSILVVTTEMPVQWNTDDLEYSIIHDAETPEFESELISGGETFTHWFETPGVYPYFCELNQQYNMKGAIIVTELPEMD